MSKSISVLCFTAIFLLAIMQIVQSLTCESCGKECRTICGTKKFRNCCFNYIKKRSAPTAIARPAAPMTVDPETEFHPLFKNLYPLEMYLEEWNGEN